MMTLFLLFLSIFTAVIPILFYVAIIWWFDRYEREPLWLVFVTFIWGAFGAIAIATIASTIFSVPIDIAFGEHSAYIAGAVIIAPIIEEIAKGIIILIIFLNRNFDNATDGFVYGSVCGLGFAMVENFLYFSMSAMEGNATQWIETVFVRTLFTAPMHALSTSCFGAAMGFIKFRKNHILKIFIPLSGIVAGMTIHFLWNVLAIASEEFQSGTPLLISILIISIEFTLIFIFFQICILLDSGTIKKELKQEIASGLIPPEHINYIPYYFKRFKNGWLPPEINKRKYISKATELAFRLFELSSCSEGNKHFYEKEVARLRNEIYSMLKGKNK